MKLLWLGTVHNSVALMESLAASPAATKWSASLLGALQDVGQEVVCVSHYHLRAWPLGPVYGRHSGRTDQRFKTVGIDAWNIPVFREYDLCKKYRRTATKLTALGSYDAVLTYNLTPWNLATATTLKGSGLPWISIVLDFKNPGKNLEAHDRAARSADGHVFLSHWAFKKCQLSPKLHLDGGVELRPYVDTNRGNATGDRMSFVYAGLIGKNNGSEFLAAALQQVKNCDAEFLIFGKGRCRKLEEAAAKDSRIKIRGYITAKELEAACEDAMAFLSPRPNDIENNSMIFPSKLLEYLKYGKPIICTPNRGMDPRYAEVVSVAPNGDPSLYANEIDKITELSPEEYAAACKKIVTFVGSSPNWRTQAARLAEWIGVVIEQKNTLASHG